jgi:hypothetical protein
MRGCRKGLRIPESAPARISILRAKLASPIRRPLGRRRTKGQRLPADRNAIAFPIPAAHRTVRKPVARCAERIKALKTWLKYSPDAARLGNRLAL